jgi:hypothetical protein
VHQQTVLKQNVKYLRVRLNIQYKSFQLLTILVAPASMDRQDGWHRKVENAKECQMALIT